MNARSTKRAWVKVASATIREAGWGGHSVPTKRWHTNQSHSRGNGGHGVPTLRRTAGCLGFVSVKIVHETSAHEPIRLRALMAGTGCRPYGLCRMR